MFLLLVFYLFVPNSALRSIKDLFRNQEIFYNIIRIFLSDAAAVQGSIFLETCYAYAHFRKKYICVAGFQMLKGTDFVRLMYSVIWYIRFLKLYRGFGSHTDAL